VPISQPLCLVIPGRYLREIREPSLTDPSLSILLCQYLTIYTNDTIHLAEVSYLDTAEGNCITTTADPLWMQTIWATQGLEDTVSQHLMSSTCARWFNLDSSSENIIAFGIDPKLYLYLKVIFMAFSACLETKVPSI
jgi:hypothetical protein